MTNPLQHAPERRLICAGCGTEFACSLDGQCWCAAEPVRLPMPDAGGDCLCRDCLHRRAAAGRSEQSS